MSGIELSAFAGDRLRPSGPAVVLRVFVALIRNPVGLVTTIRESSVLFAMAIGTLVQSETPSLRRFTGAIAVLIALIAIAL
jgi:drug/metabolite transporter (DMT)-like permease